MEHKTEGSGAEPPWLADILTTSSVTTNLGQDIHVTTRDKVELALRRTLPRYASTEQLIGTIGVFLAFAVALLTSDFKSFIGMTGEKWEALFLAAAVASFVWSVREGVRWFKRPTIDDVVGEVLRSSERIGEGNEPVSHNVTLL